jgi:hypothetical protein
MTYIYIFLFIATFLLLCVAFASVFNKKLESTQRPRANTPRPFVPEGYPPEKKRYKRSFRNYGNFGAYKNNSDKRHC